MGKKTFRQLVTRFVGVAGAAYAAASYPSPAFAASELLGLVGNGFTTFGSINPLTGAFTDINSNTGLTSHAYYAPVYDPALNAFFVIDQPINSLNPNLTFAPFIDKIDATTGAVSQIHLPLTGIPGADPYLEGLAFDTTSGQLLGLVGNGFTTFGSINPLTGAFTEINSNTGLTSHAYYAPVYDPALNALFVIDQPINSLNPNLTFTPFTDKIDATTGALSQIHLPLTGIPGADPYLEGLGVADNSAVAVTEPSSAVQLLAYALIGCVVVCAFRRSAV